jgi:hypothetical protein
VRGKFSRIRPSLLGQIQAASPSPDTPKPPGSKSLQAVATTWTPSIYRVRGLFLLEPPPAQTCNADFAGLLAFRLSQSMGNILQTLGERNDFRSRELRRRKGGSGGLTAEFDALFKLSVLIEPDALIEILVLIFGRLAPLTHPNLFVSEITALKRHRLRRAEMSLLF